MDLQAVTFFKLSERHSVKFQSEKEDEYYNSAANTAWYVSLAYKLIVETPSRLLCNSHSTIANFIRMLAQQKAKTG